jgi:hypothetical protein
MSETLAKVFDVDHEVVNATQVVVPEESENSEDSDFDYAKANYYELIEQGKAAVNTAMRIASESENPRAIEVLSGLLKNMADVNKQLVMMNKDRQDVKIAKNMAKTKSTSTVPQIGQQTNNIIMTGSLKDVTKLLKEQE